MFTELVELGKRVYTGHDALGVEKCNWDIVIDNDGNFLALIPCDVSLEAEKLPAKKGRARLLLDKPEETILGFFVPQDDENKQKKTDIEKKYELYKSKLNEYLYLKELKPVFSFYSKPKEVEKVKTAFRALRGSKQKGNMTFMVNSTRLVSLDCVTNAIKKKYEERLFSSSLNDCKCSVCGTNKYPILDESHGSVKMPKGQKAGSMLISYNNSAFESYNLKGNLNSGVCTNCARNYIEALRFLLSNGHEVTNEKGEKSFKYSNRQKISDDTVALFWTKDSNEDIDPFSDICKPAEDRIKKLFSSIATGDSQRTDVEVINYFYCCTLSSAAARIAVRDWIAISISQYQNNIRRWFEDIATLKDGKIIYPGINAILNNCIKKKTNPTQSDYKSKARIGVMLWHAALTNTSLPVIILQNVLNQIEHGYFNEEKSTVIRLVINRNIKNAYKMKEELDEHNASKAYLCGRLFALICKLQFKSQGAVNSSIKDRFFASASNSPARVMGLLLTKYVPIYEKKTKGAYSKAISEVAGRLEQFPEKFSVIERGEFALGYYYQYNAK